ncbi:hypothetical protein PVAP13_9NG377000 [Panicum virgatum]|uniref:Methyltransferase n=1 Tax=Panicum virgatum TaxID=38727 RepID=A0A8T0MPP8_PANVG|nr:hypothetical protein PVAP13_9NG377000 [Panicum virgatum]
MKYSKEDKPERAGGAGAGGRAVPVALLVIVLCAFSFYLGGVYSTGRSLLDSIQPAPTLLALGTTATQQSSALVQPAPSTTATALAAVSFPECPADFQDYTPCTDPRLWRRYGNYRLSFMERHCPPPPERQQCLVPPPKGYKPPIRWPKSKDQCWYRNVPYDWINSQKSNQHWLAKDGDRFRFPGGGTMFPNGVGAYVDAMRALIPGMRDGTVRTALDTGCGVASWGGDLLARGILTVSLAPRDNHEAQAQKADLDRLKKMLAAMCFKLYNIKGDIAVWQKSPDATACYDKLTPITTPAKCDDSVDPDAAWYVPMRPCVTAPSARYKKLGLNATPKWPQRLTVAPERINVVPGSSAGAFKQDDAKWKLRAKHYKTLLPALGTDKIRNVMDMNTVYGGFAASIIKDPVWVMNVVSSYGPNSLGVVYDRGLIGVNHDWCEAFSTYPRTYDLLHLDGLFTEESHRCEMKFVLLEMDRILRPTGYGIIRESTYFLDSVAAIAKGMRWSCERRNPENKTDKDKILICQKKLWAGKQ